MLQGHGGGRHCWRRVGNSRGYIDAYDAATGKRRWRFYTVPTAGEQGIETWGGSSFRTGGGSTWITGTYDPELNLIYWGIGSPGPDMDGDVRLSRQPLHLRRGAAIDADTGKLKWYFQFTPHDVHDWDAVADPVLVDATVDGKKIKALAQANRNGFFYLLDRTTGKYITAKAYTKVNWADGIGSDGRPILIANKEPTPEGNLVCPGLGGGHNWSATAYSPQTGLYYFGSTDGCQMFNVQKQEYVEGKQYQAGDAVGVPKEPSAGSVNAVDPATGTLKWKHELMSNPSGLLATAGGLIFTGDSDGYMMALDARTGQILWHFQTGAPIRAPAISYTFRGKRYWRWQRGPNMIAIQAALNFSCTSPVVRFRLPAQVHDLCTFRAGAQVYRTMSCRLAQSVGPWRNVEKSLTTQGAAAALKQIGCPHCHHQHSF